MLDFYRALRTHAAYGPRLIAFLVAFLIAEFAYKFHSFTLECVAFLVTWLLADIVVESIVGKPAQRKADA